MRCENVLSDTSESGCLEGTLLDHDSNGLSDTSHSQIKSCHIFRLKSRSLRATIEAAVAWPLANPLSLPCTFPGRSLAVHPPPPPCGCHPCPHTLFLALSAFSLLGHPCLLTWLHVLSQDIRVFSPGSYYVSLIESILQTGQATHSVGAGTK